MNANAKLKASINMPYKLLLWQVSSWLASSKLVHGFEKIKKSFLSLAIAPYGDRESQPIGSSYVSCCRSKVILEVPLLLDVSLTQC